MVVTYEKFESSLPDPVWVCSTCWLYKPVTDSWWYKHIKMKPVFDPYYSFNRLTHPYIHTTELMCYDCARKKGLEW